MTSGPHPETGIAVHHWALGPLDEAGREKNADGSPRFPDLAALRHRALGPERLLDRYAAEVVNEANKSGHDDAWKTYALARLYVAWANAAPAATKARRVAARALEDRRAKIARAATTLKNELVKNQYLGPEEVAAGLRAFPVAVRFPGLLPMLDEVVVWSEREDARAVLVDEAPASVRFRDAAVDILGFEPSWTCLADLWNLFANDLMNEMTDDKIRIACSRADEKRTNRT